MACLMGPSRRSSRGCTRFSNSPNERVTFRSVSSIRHSTAMDASDTPAGDSVFLAFSAAASSFSLPCVRM